MRISDWSSDVCSSDLKRNRQSCGLPRVSRSRLDQRPDCARKWRHRMMNNLTGTQVVLVTGSGSGIGYAIATVLSRAGHTVYASLRLTLPEGAKRARSIRSLASAVKLALQMIGRAHFFSPVSFSHLVFRLFLFFNI